MTRWHAYKGLDNLIRAFKIVNENIDVSRLVVVGGGELVTTTRSWLEILDWRGASCLLEASQRLAAQYYAACDLFVLPSRDSSEGYGLALLEAMATRKPVIGSRVGGNVDVIQDQITGILVQPNEPTALANAILNLLRNNELRLRTEGAARGSARQNDWERVTQNVEQLYRQVTHSY